MYRIFLRHLVEEALLLEVFQASGNDGNEQPGDVTCGRVGPWGWEEPICCHGCFPVGKYECILLQGYSQHRDLPIFFDLEK